MSDITLMMFFLFGGIFLLQWIIFFIIAKMGMQDTPDHRKMHSSPKATMGGFLFIIPFFLAGGIQVIGFSLYSLTAVVLLIFTGIYDDYREVSPKFKLISQSITGALMFFVGKGFTDFLGAGAPALMFLLTVFFFVGMINIINLIDGADGLAASICIIILSGLI
ncbi:MAG: hypothetical protein ACOCWO_03450, partial [Candidatus Muiribacteriaceae bacterium]